LYIEYSRIKESPNTANPAVAFSTKIQYIAVLATTFYDFLTFSAERGDYLTKFSKFAVLTAIQPQGMRSEMSNKELIDGVVAQSAYSDELREVFSDHFDDVTQPVSMSLGVYMDGRRIDEVAGMLRKNGIDAMPFYDPKAAENPNLLSLTERACVRPFSNRKTPFEPPPTFSKR